MEREQGRVAEQNVREARRRDAANEYGQQRRHGQVYHQHLQREHQSRYRGLEDAGDGSRGTAADERHQRLVVQPEQPPQVRPDGRPRQHYRSLGTHRAAEADGDGRGDDRRPRVVGLQP